MKTLLFILSIVCSASLTTTSTRIDSQVYHWKDIDVAGNASYGKNVIFEGSTRDLSHLEVSGYRLRAGGEQNQNDFSDGQEHLVIVKDGMLDVKIQSGNKVLAPGSVAMVMPGEQFTLSDPDKTDAYYYVFSYSSTAPADTERGTKAGGSFIVDWNDLTFKEHDKGGVRQYFGRSTAMCDYFDIHMTTLNAGLKSHDPHTHRAAEIILMMDGDTKMLIGDNFYEGSKGDVYFVKSEILHGIQNIGSKPAMYFAIQWQ